MKNTDNIDYNELLEKYHLLLNENNRLIKENSRLKSQIKLMESEVSRTAFSITKKEEIILDNQSTDTIGLSDVNRKSDTLSKINLFMSLFKGRNDVYAKRWENKNKGTSAYSPDCLNLWQKGDSDERENRPFF